MNIKVAIRCRPFNQRELDIKSDLCVSMNKTQTHIISENGEIDRTFNYDHCFWSHDGFESDSSGYCRPNGRGSESGRGQEYHDQDHVYGVLGKDILKSALEGYNCCLFAYGQTGAGKSYSIFGYGANKGIVPKICEELLNGRTLINDDKHSFTVSVSMLEIYNERAQDLLIPVSDRPKGGYKIRENSKLGVYVEDLMQREVKSYAEIEEVIELGNKNKTLGSTLMNATSSRAHTIITLELVQKEVGLIKTIQRDSVIHLVDLAGSEKVAKTDAKGDRLKEACSINKSLTQLGMVIHQLYLKSTGDKVVVSYRDSVLTRILQNSLGGNSRTTMICAVSPARDNIEETLSTLRYADQAKMIKQNAHVNESETDKLIRELMEENERLKKLLAASARTEVGETPAQEEISGQIRALNEVINFRMGSPNQRKLSINKNHRPEIEEASFDPNVTPHLSNLNEDPLLSGKVLYNLSEHPVIRIGRQGEGEVKASELKVVLNGVGIQQNHAVLRLSGGLAIEAGASGSAASIFVNGESLQSLGGRASLVDCDRLIFGTSATFLVRLPGVEGLLTSRPMMGDQTIDWEFCQMEKFKLQERAERERLQQAYEEKEAALRAKEEEVRINFEREKEQFERRLKCQQEEFQRLADALQRDILEKQSSQRMLETETHLAHQNTDLVKQLHNEQKTRELEYQVRMHALNKERELLDQVQAINMSIEKRLISFYSLIKEANIIAAELHRNISFSPFVASLNLLSSLNSRNSAADLIINVKVTNYEEGWLNFWTLEKFEARLVLMREAIENYFSKNRVSFSESNDPFWDPEEYFLFGQSFAMAKSILYRFEITLKIGLLGYEGDIGSLQVQLLPIDDEGKELDEEEIEEEVQEPEDLIVKKLSCHYLVLISKLILFDIDKLRGKRAFINYEVMTSRGVEEFTSNHFIINDNQTDVNHRQTVSIQRVTPELVDYYMSKNIQFKLFIEHLEVVQKRGKLPPPQLLRERGDTAYSNARMTVPCLSNSIVESPAGSSPRYRKDGSDGGHKKQTKPENICSIF